MEYIEQPRKILKKNCPSPGSFKVNAGNCKEVCEQ